MAYNRPKSLDELNSIFDKTITAEKAIKKNSSKLEKGEDSFTSFSEESAPAGDKEPVPTEAPSEPITEKVSDFIAKFSAEPEAVKARPQMTVLTPDSPVTGHTPAAEEQSVAEAPVAAPTEKPDRDELFKDYARIMSDDDDDASDEKRLSRKEKKLLKRKLKAEKKAAREKAEAEKAVAEEPAAEATVIGEPAMEEPATEKQTVEEPVIEEPVAEEPVIEEPVTEEPVIEEPVIEEPAAEEVFPKDADIQSIEQEDDDFDFPEDHVPEWMKDEEESYEVIEDPLADRTRVLHTLLKVVLSIVLVLAISIGALATVFKTVVAVNTGKLVSDRYYVFTSYKDYTELGLSKGDLIVTEKKYAEEGEVFAYVDYSSRSFEFGRRTDSITKDDGEVLYVTEKDGSRTLVSRDDCKGVVWLTYGGRGDIVSFLTDNYVILVAAAVVISLAVILTFVLALRPKREDEFSEYETAGEDDFEDIFSTIE